MAIVTLIIGILARLAVPGIRRAQDNTRASILMSDFRTFASAFQHYYASAGKWPADQATSAKFPANMAGYLNTTNWDKPTIIGGLYNWDYNVVHVGKRITAAIAIHSDKKNPLKVTNAQLLAIDKKFDDGNLSTGIFRLGFQNAPLFIIEN